MTESKEISILRGILLEFRREYSLSHEKVLAGVEKALTNLLSRRYGKDVSVFFDGDDLSCFVFYENTEGIMHQRELSLQTIRGWNTLKKHIRFELLMASVWQDYERYKSVEKQARWGEIVHVAADGMLYIDIEILPGEVVTCVCPNRFQMPKERGALGIGDRNAWHVRKIEVTIVENVPRLTVTLDRISKNLPVELLYARLLADPTNQKVPEKITCTKRYAGGTSKIKSTGFIPKDVIKAVSSELKEGLEVTYKPNLHQILSKDRHKKHGVNHFSMEPESLLVHEGKVVGIYA